MLWYSLMRRTVRPHEQAAEVWELGGWTEEDPTHHEPAARKVATPQMGRANSGGTTNARSSQGTPRLGTGRASHASRGSAILRHERIGLPPGIAGSRDVRAYHEQGGQGWERPTLAGGSMRVKLPVALMLEESPPRNAQSSVLEEQGLMTIQAAPLNDAEPPVGSPRLRRGSLGASSWRASQEDAAGSGTHEDSTASAAAPTALGGVDAVLVVAGRDGQESLTLSLSLVQQHRGRVSSRVPAPQPPQARAATVSIPPLPLPAGPAGSVQLPLSHRTGRAASPAPHNSPGSGLRRAHGMARGARSWRQEAVSATPLGMAVAGTGVETVAQTRFFREVRTGAAAEGRVVPIDMILGEESPSPPPSLVRQGGPLRANEAKSMRRHANLDGGGGSAGVEWRREVLRRGRLQRGLGTGVVDTAPRWGRRGSPGSPPSYVDGQETPRSALWGRGARWRETGTAASAAVLKAGEAIARRFEAVESPWRQSTGVSQDGEELAGEQAPSGPVPPGGSRSLDAVPPASDSCAVAELAAGAALGASHAGGSPEEASPGARTRRRTRAQGVAAHHGWANEATDTMTEGASRDAWVVLTTSLVGKERGRENPEHLSARSRSADPADNRLLTPETPGPPSPEYVIRPAARTLRGRVLAPGRGAGRLVGRRGTMGGDKQSVGGEVDQVAEGTLRVEGSSPPRGWLEQPQGQQDKDHKAARGVEGQLAPFDGGMAERAAVERREEYCESAQAGGGGLSGALNEPGRLTVLISRQQAGASPRAKQVTAPRATGEAQLGEVLRTVPLPVPPNPPRARERTGAGAGAGTDADAAGELQAEESLVRLGRERAMLAPEGSLESVPPNSLASMSRDSLPSSSTDGTRTAAQEPAAVVKPLAGGLKRHGGSAEEEAAWVVGVEGEYGGEAEQAPGAHASHVDAGHVVHVVVDVRHPSPAATRTAALGAPASQEAPCRPGGQIHGSKVGADAVADACDVRRPRRPSFGDLGQGEAASLGPPASPSRATRGPLSARARAQAALPPRTLAIGLQEIGGPRIPAPTPAPQPPSAVGPPQPQPSQTRAAAPQLSLVVSGGHPGSASDGLKLISSGRSRGAAGATEPEVGPDWLVLPHVTLTFDRASASLRVERSSPGVGAPLLLALVPWQCVEECAARSRPPALRPDLADSLPRPRLGGLIPIRRRLCAPGVGLAVGVRALGTRGGGDAGAGAEDERPSAGLASQDALACHWAHSPRRAARGLRGSALRGAAAPATPAGSGVSAGAARLALALSGVVPLETLARLARVRRELLDAGRAASGQRRTVPDARVLFGPGGEKEGQLPREASRELAGLVLRCTCGLDAEPGGDEGRGPLRAAHAEVLEVVHAGRGASQRRAAAPAGPSPRDALPATRWLPRTGSGGGGRARGGGDQVPAVAQQETDAAARTASLQAPAPPRTAVHATHRGAAEGGRGRVEAAWAEVVGGSVPRALLEEVAGRRQADEAFPRLDARGLAHPPSPRRAPPTAPRRAVAHPPARPRLGPVGAAVPGGAGAELGGWEEHVRKALRG